ncbi:hypothetical protein BB558_003382 [Smittium angustum]|uniref:Uncharacterized protein n=1 Tax=Smittium angustum TaxID=133377 RepID=A0A2U1J662_SMIAN|nr:hypothetical protein BB558_003382 [Smittium angustum]
MNQLCKNVLVRSFFGMQTISRSFPPQNIFSLGILNNTLINHYSTKDPKNYIKKIIKKAKLKEEKALEKSKNDSSHMDQVDQEAVEAVMISRDNIWKTFKEIEGEKVMISSNMLDKYKPTTGKYVEYLAKTPEQLYALYGNSVHTVLAINNEEITAERKELIRSIAAGFNIKILREYLKLKKLDFKGPKKVLILRIIREVWGMEHEVSNMNLKLIRYIKMNANLRKKVIRPAPENYFELTESSDFLDSLGKKHDTKITPAKDKSLLIEGSMNKILLTEKGITNELIRRNTVNIDLGNYTASSKQKRYNEINSMISLGYKTTGALLKYDADTRMLSICTKKIVESSKLKQKLLHVFGNSNSGTLALVNMKNLSNYALIPASDPLSLENFESRLYKNRFSAITSGDQDSFDLENLSLVSFTGAGCVDIPLSLSEYWGNIISTQMKSTMKSVETTKSGGESIRPEFYLELGRMYTGYSSEEEYYEGTKGDVRILDYLKPTGAHQMFSNRVSPHPWLSELDGKSSENGVLKLAWIPENDKVERNGPNSEYLMKVTTKDNTNVKEISSLEKIVDINHSVLLVPNSKYDLRLKGYTVIDKSKEIESCMDLNTIINNLNSKDVVINIHRLARKKLELSDGVYTLGSISVENSTEFSLTNGYSMVVKKTIDILNNSEDFKVKLRPTKVWDDYQSLDNLAKNIKDSVEWQKFISFCVKATHDSPSTRFGMV